MIQVRHNKKMETEGLSFYHLNLMCCLDQMLAVIELSQNLVSSSKTVRPIIPRGARCVGHVKKMWFAVCSLAPHSHFAEEARPHLCMDEPKRPTPVRRQLSLTQAFLVKLIPMGLVQQWWIFKSGALRQNSNKGPRKIDLAINNCDQTTLPSTALLGGQ